MTITCPLCGREHMLDPLTDDMFFDYIFRDWHRAMVRCECGWFEQVAMVPVVQ